MKLRQFSKIFKEIMDDTEYNRLIIIFSDKENTLNINKKFIKYHSIDNGILTIVGGVSGNKFYIDIEKIVYLKLEKQV